MLPVMQPTLQAFIVLSYSIHRDLHSFPTRRSSDLMPATKKASAKSPSQASTAPSKAALTRVTADAKLATNANKKRAERSEEHTSELQSRRDLVCRLLLEKKHHQSSSGRHVQTQQVL